MTILLIQRRRNRILGCISFDDERQLFDHLDDVFENIKNNVTLGFQKKNNNNNNVTLGFQKKKNPLHQFRIISVY